MLTNAKDRNAVIMAAGMSSRFVPLSIEKPKALLNVKGEILIERQIKQLKEAGINEIIIVVGYLKEQFNYLVEKEGVILIDNPYFQSKNNHSSLYVARKYINNTFICSGDNYFLKNVFKENVDYSYYAAIFHTGSTEEWCLSVDEQNLITNVTIGGNDSWVMHGHVYFTNTFATTLISYIEQVFHDEAKSSWYWEQVYLEHISELPLYQKSYSPDVICEFDSLAELRQFDDNYLNNTGSPIMQRLCHDLDCSEGEIQDIEPLKKSGLVVGMTFVNKDATYKMYYENKELHKGE